jgi:segregation and condensation protein A
MGDVAQSGEASHAIGFDGFDDFEDVRESNAFVVDVEGFEGPLDLLLSLARANKLDLTKISMLALAQQYLEFIAALRELRLEVAADYLVMAAWLTYLKSRLLLPEDEDEEEPTGEELAALLTFRLRRLEAMRDAVAQLMTRKRLGRDFFARGMPEGIRLVRTSEYEANVFDLLKAYAERRRRASVRSIQFSQRNVWSIKDARARLEPILGASSDWAPLEVLLAQYLEEAETRPTAMASSFGASLELAREGEIELKQAEAFAPLYLRRRQKSNQ